jgi:hypothetical protein
MKNLMGNVKLKTIDVGNYKKEGREIVAVPESELEFTKIFHCFKEDDPVKDDGRIERYLEEDVVFFELFSLLFIGVPGVLRAYLIKQWKEDIHECHYRPSMILKEKVGHSQAKGEHIVGEAGQHKAVFAEDVYLLGWQQSFHHLC